MENPMKAFVGKLVIRTVARDCYRHQLGGLYSGPTREVDRSYMLDPIRLVSVGEQIAYYKNTTWDPEKIRILPADYCDENWEVVDESLLTTKPEGVSPQPEKNDPEPLEKNDANLGEEQTPVQSSGDESVLQ